MLNTDCVAVSLGESRALLSSVAGRFCYPSFYVSNVFLSAPYWLRIQDLSYTKFPKWIPERQESSLNDLIRANLATTSHKKYIGVYPQQWYDLDLSFLVDTLLRTKMYFNNVTESLIEEWMGLVWFPLLHNANMI